MIFKMPCQCLFRLHKAKAFWQKFFMVKSGVWHGLLAKNSKK
jgi:hypothetical protein